MLQNTILLLLTVTTLVSKGEALPNGIISGEGSSNSSVISANEDADCATSGHVTNVIIQGGGGGVRSQEETGPQGERGDTGPPGPAGPSGGGVSYTRWGRTTCPNTQGTQLVYTGAVVGSAYHEGGSSEFLCLHNDPQFLRTTSGYQGRRARLYGTEYIAIEIPLAFFNMAHHDAPCSVCYSGTRSTKITIPGRTSCPSSWTREYYGYLMSSGRYDSHKSKVPICVDVSAESVTGSAGATVKSLLLFMETTCTGIKCPPYSNGKEITCTVCTK